MFKIIQISKCRASTAKSDCLVCAVANIHTEYRLSSLLLKDEAYLSKKNNDIR